MAMSCEGCFEDEVRPSNKPLRGCSAKKCMEIQSIPRPKGILRASFGSCSSREQHLRRPYR